MEWIDYRVLSTVLITTIAVVVVVIENRTRKAFIEQVYVLYTAESHHMTHKIHTLRAPSPGIRKTLLPSPLPQVVEQ